MGNCHRAQHSPRAQPRDLMVVVGVLEVRRLVAAVVVHCSQAVQYILEDIDQVLVALPVHLLEGQVFSGPILAMGPVRVVVVVVEHQGLLVVDIRSLGIVHIDLVVVEDSFDILGDSFVVVVVVVRMELVVVDLVHQAVDKAQLD